MKGGVGKGTPKGREGKGSKGKEKKRYKVTKGEWYRTVGEIKRGEAHGDKQMASFARQGTPVGVSMSACANGVNRRQEETP